MMRSGNSGRVFLAAGDGIVGKLLSLGVTFLLMTSIVVAVPFNAPVARADDASDAITAALGELSDALSGLDNLDELADLIPFTDALPTGGDGLDLVNAFTELLENALAGAPTASDVQTALNDLDGTTLGGTSIVANVAATITGSDPYTVTFTDLRLSRAGHAAELMVDNDDIALNGLSLDIDFLLTAATAATPLTLVVTEGVPPTIAIDASTTPTITLGATASANLDPGLSATLGIGNVTLSGEGTPAPDIAISANFNVDFLDPDSDGTISGTELTTTAPLDLFNVAWGSSTATIGLNVTSSLIPGVGTVTLNDTDLGDGIDTPVVALGDIGDLSNMSPQDAILAIAQLALSIDALQLQIANPDIPLLDQGLGQLIQINEKLEKFFADQGLLAAGGGPYDFDFTLEDLKTKGLNTIEGVIAKLEMSLGTAAGALGLGYSGGNLTFTINKSYGSGDTTDPTLTLDLGDQLAGVGIIGLDAASATVTADPTFTMNLTAGIDVSTSPIITDGSGNPTGVTPITDRVFIETSASPEITADMPVTANLDLRGHVGLLDLALVTCDDAGPTPTCDATADDVTLLQAAGTGAMLEIDLDGGADNKITLTELFNALSAPGGVTFNAAGSPPTATITSGGNTLTAKLDIEVPKTNLNASASVGSTPLADGIVSFELPNLLDLISNPSAFSVSATDFDAFSAFDTDDPEAFFALIVNAVSDLLMELDGLSGDGLDFEIPLVGVNFSDLTDVFAQMATQVQALVATPAGGLESLEALIELKIFEVLQETGFVDGGIALPEIPDSADFPDLGAYEAALTTFLTTELPGFLAANADFLDLSYDPGDGSTAPALLLELGFDKTQTISKPFNLDMAALGATSLSSVISAGGSGDLDLTYGIDAGLTLGLELDGLTSAPRPFLLDTSGVSVYADGGLSGGELAATVGPFSVRIGEAGSVAESGDDCANATDDDGDGLINDGCPEVGGDSETGDQCLNNTDDDDDSAEDDDVNDGCPFEFGASAGFRASFDASNDIGGIDRVYFFPTGSETGIGTWASGVASKFSFPNPAGLGGGPAGTTQCSALDAGKPAVCANLPFFLEAGSTTVYLADVSLALEGLDPGGWTLPDFTPLIDAIAANATDLALALLVEGVGSFLDFLEESLDAAAYNVDIPVLGDALDAGADIVGIFNDGIVTPVGDAIASAGGATSDAIDMLLTDALEGALDTDLGVLLNAGDDIVVVDCGAAATPCSLAQIEAIDVILEIGQTTGEISSGELPFDFAVPGLRLDMGGAMLTTEGSWGLNIGFGLSRTEGFYLLTDNTDISVGADVNLDFGPDPIVGDIAFIQLLITDGKDTDTPEASLTFELDVTGGGGKLPLSQLLSGPDPLGFDPNIVPVVDLDFDLETQFDVGGDTSNALPKLLATFQVGWAPADLLEDPEFDAFTAAFTDVQLDLGSFIAEFLGPILEDVNRYLKPIKPVIDTISAPVPGIAQLAELVGQEPPTLLDLFEGVSGNDLTFIRRIIDLINFVTAVGDVAANVTPDGSCSLCIPIGSFDLAGDKLFQPALPASQRASLIGTSTPTVSNILDEVGNINNADLGSGASEFKSAFSKSRTGGGFSFPVFENPSQLFELLVGANPTLIEWRSGLLKASFGFSQSFGPIFVGPIPISIVISGSAGVEGQIGVGYDTKGIRQLVEILTDDNPSNDSFFGGVSALLAGVFIDDLDENGNDVPEIAFFAEIAAGAALDLVIVSAGIEGGIRAEITLNLHDGGYASPPPPENLDGKLRIDEIVSFVANPLCIFDVGGKLSAFLRAFVEIDLFLFSKKFAFTIVNITLLEFDNLFADACKPAEPEPATVIGGVLRLNMGPFAGDRNFASDEEAERFVLRQIDADSVSVTAFGIEKTYDGVTSVFAHGGTGDDVIVLETGVTPENSGVIDSETGEQIINNGSDQQQDFVLPAILCGGAGDDRILAGYGDDKLYGDGDEAVTAASTSCPDTNPANDGNDTLNGNGGADSAFGQGGNDIITGDAGDDPELRGGAGEDEIAGGAGRDVIYGDGENDTLLGGPEPEPTGTEADDEIHGGGGDDSIEGDWGDDDLFGDADDDIIIGNQGGDTIDGGSGNDRILGNEDDDDIAGNAGDDEIQGNDGADDIYGDDRSLASAATGRDDIVGGAGIDNVWGGPGEDVILGDEGEIFRNQLTLGSDPFAPPDSVTPLFMLKAGDPFGDTLNGGADADLIYGQAGNDTINGDAGNDNLHGNDGIDTMSGNGGADNMFGDAGNDQMYGDSATPVAAEDGADTMRGGNDNDTMRGNAAGDSIFGDSGADVIYGDAETPDGANDGSDTARGGSGNDTISGNGDGDFLFGDGDNDTIYGDAAVQDSANDGADTISGGEGDDLAFGNADGDDIDGDNGADRLIGGSAVADEPDGIDTMNGGNGADVMAGDNATIGAGASAGAKLVTLLLDGQGAGDTMNGDADGDRMFGQTGSDDMSGGPGADYMEGNDGSDDIRGDDGNDDLIGGGSANDGATGVIDADRTGDGLADEADEISGGNDADWIAGDNARIDRNFDLGTTDDLVLFDVNSTDAAYSGGDRIDGGANDDVIFGQGNGGQVPENQGDAPDGVDNDLDGATDEDGAEALGGFLGDIVRGGSGNDYIEGNHGGDLLIGEAGEDDLIGGGSSDPSGTGKGVIVLNNGIVDAARNGSGLDDGRDTMYGDADRDLMAGDNALIARNFGVDAPVVLFDVNSTDATASSGDWMSGGDANDLMFGQGNGSQPSTQADPIDGVDNDLDGTTDEAADQPWLGDIMFGNDGSDYMEGNHGADLMFGGLGNDDMVGGGSANDDSAAETGTFVGTRTGDDLKDGSDVMYGEAGDDWMTGDNGLIERNESLGAANDFVLFDVNSTNQAASAGDFMDGGADNDRMFGQGNGAQAGQSDPLDGVDNDGDGMTDENQPWFGDVMLGGTGDDYMEGNHGSDIMWGDDADGDATDDGEDDVIGGGSATNGIIALDGGAFDTARTGNGLNDDGDVLRGEGGIDFLAGDNARIDETGITTGLTLPTSSDRSVQLFDVELTGAPVGTGYSGGDWMSGGDAADVMFGQGNGAQPATEADPRDSADNDFDGREDATSTEYDCADGFDNDGDGLVDGAEAGCSAAVDEDSPWHGDVMFGDAGEDYIEGNHGADWMFGNEGEDDMIGGGSANDGAILATRDPMGLTDGPDIMAGNDEDDVMTGDNARINRVANGAGTDWVRISTPSNPEPGYVAYDQAVRVTDMHDGDAGANTHGNDYMTGNGGNDEMYGQLGDDFILGNEGDDAMVGDLGKVTANIIGDDPSDPAPEDISTNSPHWDDRIYERGSMWWETVLYAFDTSAGGVGGNDTMLGYDGRDTAFGGPGDDVINGDGDGTEELLDVAQPEFSHITDVDPSTSDRDMLFGGDGGDAIWGGRDNDILMGGHGDDFLDVRPREETDNGRNGANFRIIPRDPASWFTYAVPENLQDVDFIYGGWDRDALQADQAANGPDPGDRLADWAGGYNVFYLCPSGYGDYTILRQGSPHSRRFLQDLAEASGAIGAADDGTSGFRDLGYVFPNQRGQNSHPPHPDHPGHFTCVDYTGVGSGVATADAGGPYQVDEGGTVALDGTGSAGFGSLSYSWDVTPLGIDDPTSATPTVSAAGLDDATVPVELEITDGDGGMAVAGADVVVVNVAPAVTLNSLTTSVATGDPADIAVAYADPGVLDTHTALIDWGDGATCAPDVAGECALVANGGGTGTVTGTHSYADGTWDVTVTVTDDDGGATVLTAGTVTVGDVVPPAPDGVFTAGEWIATDPWPVDPLTVAGVDYTRSQAITVMQSGSNNERSGTLFREVAAALLNAALGNDTSCVDATLVDAQTWLIAHPPGSGVKNRNKAWKNEATAYWQELVDYNAGALCAPAA